MKVRTQPFVSFLLFYAFQSDCSFFYSCFLNSDGSVNKKSSSTLNLPSPFLFAGWFQTAGEEENSVLQLNAK